MRLRQAKKIVYHEGGRKYSKLQLEKAERTLNDRDRRATNKFKRFLRKNLGPLGYAAWEFECGINCLRYKNESKIR